MGEIKIGVVEFISRCSLRQTHLFEPLLIVGQQLQHLWRIGKACVKRNTFITKRSRRIIKKADDTNVRLSTISQELEAVRQAMSSMPTAPAAAAAGLTEPTSPTGEPGAAPAGGAPVPTTPAGSAPFISPQRMYDNAYSDYTGGQYDIAIQGFTAYIASFPKSDQADNAQLNIGNAYYAAGKYREAAEAFQKAISNYPNSDSVPAAYYKLGLTYTDLKQPDLARRAFETVTQKYPTAPESILAKQRLDALNRK